jgi:hypothetical protein
MKEKNQLFIHIFFLQELEQIVLKRLLKFLVHARRSRKIEKRERGEARASSWCSSIKAPGHKFCAELNSSIPKGLRLGREGTEANNGGNGIIPGGGDLGA